MIRTECSIIWSDGALLGVAIKNRKDPWVQGDIEDAKTFAVLLESTKRSIHSTVDCFDTRHGRALPSCEAGVVCGSTKWGDDDDDKNNTYTSKKDSRFYVIVLLRINNLTTMPLDGMKGGMMCNSVGLARPACFNRCIRHCRWQ
jgi:hypothetical protein